jgi:predicted lipid-binding transport protein (Tim44 family)
MTSAAAGKELTMTPKSNWVELSALCALFIVLSLVGIVWNITSGLLTSGIDGIMLLFICLMMGGIFSIMLLVMLWQARMIPVFKHDKATPAASAAVKAEAPAKAAAQPDLRSATQASDQEVKAPAAKPAAPAKPSPPPAAK